MWAAQSGLFRRSDLAILTSYGQQDIDFLPDQFAYDQAEKLACVSGHLKMSNFWPSENVFSSKK